MEIELVKNFKMAVLYLGLTSQAKDVIELYNYYYQTKNMPIKQVNEKRKRLRYL